jgi:hypothetical protein
MTVGITWSRLNASDTWLHPSDRTLVQVSPISSTGESGQYKKCPVKGYNGSICLGAIKPSTGCPWAGCWAPSHLGGLCKYAWKPSNSLVLARAWSDYEWVILVRLHCEITSSGTRCSSCKPVVLITLEGCRLLDSLVVSSLSRSMQEYCSVLRRRICEGYHAHPVGATKSNTSKASHWATLTFGIGSCGAQRVG